MMWYGLLLFMLFSVHFHPLLWHCVFVMFCYSFSFLQVEVAPPMTGKILEEEAVTTSFAASPGVEEEPFSGSMTEEVGQPM